MARQLSGNRDLVFAAIVAAAEADRPCPTDPELTRIGAGSSTFAHSTMRHFVAKGLIRIHNYGNARQVTIVATGKSTRLDRYSQPVVPLPTLPERVSRDPCPRCGVRGDVDCGHPKAALVTATGVSGGSSIAGFAGGAARTGHSFAYRR